MFKFLEFSKQMLDKASLTNSQISTKKNTIISQIEKAMESIQERQAIVA